MKTNLALPDDGLCPGVPVPEEHGAVLAAADDVAVGGIVALWPGQAGDYAIVTEYYLAYLRSFSRKHPKNEH